MFTHSSTLINKEEIIQMKFRGSEVLNNENDIRERRAELYRAMILGNAYHGKCSIIFETENGPRRVETTVWAATEHFVTLKGGIIIPVRCISEVSI